MIPQVCTIAGSDSGGGAGIQADLKTFQERDVFGTSVIIAITAQNTLGVHGVYPVPIEGVIAQLDALFSDFSLSAIKTGMLLNSEYIIAISDYLKAHSTAPLIVDPVMIAKGGASLMATEATQAMIDHLLPIATLITPNIPEAETILNRTITTEEAMEQAAKDIQALGAKNVLIKGGHSLNVESARDFLWTEKGEGIWFDSRRHATKDTHGTGCTFSACIAAEVGKGQSLEDAIGIAKAFITSAIVHGIEVGHGHGPTNHAAYRQLGAVE
ncbi:bifunctional hydroxymethylpyrimidine kinase/phosphomethylpyrimidine kinase [Wohlfahrtiimonas chitiniclastica]|uniref:hydroxymethylpyrimidine kinase n=1 Tax=Wohlfahrtiimonas chitiniclastica TaxID=400946 RepID=A0AB35C0A8_9GAMM|nr:bifunctional hydroxymethylpyrimidine kinase/phosphomethylpyrimidine kinase [Wohlfahrtiimonas chitiniclastica]MBS7825166.1 bifunctional hydroxymethylpyrimidine kinase/phosphomethylpyrimidine kinase [Wohlfahrtiimonas chitiniclastica]MBS7840778.1 bifunctional hydroxymethylpyrimidine kinase/phosphomethylpyrimidine kinase [Wohlfahrtiimonas chitiniclastica]